MAGEHALGPGQLRLTDSSETAGKGPFRDEHGVARLGTAGIGPSVNVPALFTASAPTVNWCIMLAQP